MLLGRLSSDILLAFAALSLLLQLRSPIANGTNVPALSVSVDQLQQETRADTHPAPPLPPSREEIVRALKEEENGRFWRVWAQRAFAISSPSTSETETPKAQCWEGFTQSAREFVEWVLRGGEKGEQGDPCDENWTVGVGGEYGKKEFRPSFPSGRPPVLLGFDLQIKAFCKAKVRGTLGEGALPASKSTGSLRLS
uniref:Uncharacterized protein n=1 Tax=Chromera velia CCMP2878 TaxID=1169474 RepID=A0A0G4IF21_9ALVE|eukprot:Cvel_2462.t1-p1 / transcript=Cvel_2462.t1 / gene=Cvel_2462 / organism=Chromera_velia_CCMP2878 / gene_product=hypothetical protein / transcript_product=hypothetical protein / location=Cvel_scaffold96:126635-127219(-) / protein_length=195 / sequence_SO=supercontig / SO=protein_coding / is_pseudo=false